ncbi:MAG: glycoside hydrolase family 3 C-terminal domain-containing protein [Anaerolineae bacterium]|nr:glycoside hydrolase family 3 C-terminal domain-containing protein [Anaerolineae bacterium]
MSKFYIRRRLTQANLPSTITTLLVLLVLLVQPALTPVQAQEPDEYPWMDTTLSAEERARALLDASTLEQKMRWLVEHSANNPTGTSFSGVEYPEQLPYTPDITYTDGPTAVSGPSGITSFPTQVSLASTWDTALAREKGAAQGSEAFQKGRNVFLAPGLASGRVPLSGRTSEYLGEDPLLAGLMAAAITRGIQEDNPDEPVSAQLKHYVANEQETNRQTSSSNLDEKTLREIYTLPFEIAVKEGDPDSVMCSFNQINGIYSCENPDVLKGVLKDSIGFEGWVVSDFGSVHSTGDSLNAGMDQELNRPRYYTPENLQAALDAGEITEEQIDEAAFRVLRAHIRRGLFDTPLPEEIADNVSTEEHQAIALEIIEKGSVLLKNVDDILPLSGTGQTIAVIGATASLTATNGVSAKTACAHTRPSVNCDGLEVSPLDAITTRAEGNTVVFDDGSSLAGAATTAANADVAIVFGYYTMSEFSDINNLSLLPQANTTLFEAASAGDTNIKLSNLSNIDVGSKIVIDTDDSQETVTATAIGTAATDEELAFAATAGDTNIKVTGVGGLVAGDTLTIDSDANLETVTVTAIGSAGGTTLSSATDIGDTTLPVASVSGFAVGDTITIDSGSNLETRTITNISSGWGGRSITVDAALSIAHDAGVQVSGSGITFIPALTLDHATGTAIQSSGTGITFAPALVQDHDSGAAVFSPYGDNLIQTVAAANPNTIVILQTGSAVLMPWLDDVKGVMEVWYAGQEMGEGIANLLWGDANPSGKLPHTFPKSENDLPTAGSEEQFPGIMDGEGIRQVDYTEGTQVGYRWYDQQGIEPLFEFGFGLSYAEFEYSDLVIEQDDGKVTVSFKVKNTGDVAGIETPQVYIEAPLAQTVILPVQVTDLTEALSRPHSKELAGFTRVELEPGEEKEVTIELYDLILSSWSTDAGEWQLDEGLRRVYVGSSSRDIRLINSTNVGEDTTICGEWMNTSLTAEQRAQALLDASTLEQKMRWLVEPSANNPYETEIGGWGGSATYPEQVPCTPFIQFTDSPNSVTSRNVTGITAFPAQISLAATWNEELSWEKGQAHGYEAFYKMNNVLLAPGLASGRVPYLGRNSEYLGEDPLLGGLMAAENIRGMQEGNPEAPVEAVLKHYVANEQELDRTSSSSNMDEQTLREIYTLPYEIAIKEGEPGGIMCAFNQINGVWSCENGVILQDILKDEWGFDGWVVSDFFGVHSTADSLVGGLDQELVSPNYFSPENLYAALDAGEITREQIDEAAFRVVSSHIEAGLFDHPLPEERVEDVSTPANQAVALQVAEEGSVLLKNAGDILPLSGTGQTIAVIGATASYTPVVVSNTAGIGGGWSGPAPVTRTVNAETACGTSTPAADCSKLETPLEGITARATQDGNTVIFNDGSNLTSAASTAANADVAIVFGYYLEGEGMDRPHLSLDHASVTDTGDDLVSAVAAANLNTVVILQTGGPVLMPWIDDVKGVVEIWYAGQEMGPAIAAILWGDVNPSGKLPQTFPVSEDDLPTAGSEAQYPGIVNEEGIRQVDYTEGTQVGYRWYDQQGIEPLFEFGFGLSYTEFEYSDLAIVQDNGQVTVSFKVKNVGNVAGIETPQIYIGGALSGTVQLPARISGPHSKELAGFTRVELEPGEEQEVTLKLYDRILSSWSTDAGEWQLDEGLHWVYVGASSRDIRLSNMVNVGDRSRLTIYLPLILK